MKRNVLRRWFSELDRAIQKLKAAEKELDSLDLPDGVFAERAQSIRAKLKEPSKASEVDQEMSALRQQIRASEVRARQSEDELNHLKAPQGLFGEEIQSIRMKLRQLDRVDEVELEVGALRTRVADIKRRQKDAHKRLEALHAPEDVFGEDIKSIRERLKDPSRIDEMERELRTLESQVEDFERNIDQRLERAERELNELDPPEDVFGPQTRSIRAKLKRREKLVEIEQELSVLRRQLDEYRGIPMHSPEQVVDSARLTVPPDEHTLPHGLQSSYYDVSLIGSGGFARVFRAKRKSDGTEVAIKVPLKLDAQTGKSFLSEITSWQHLKHQNIVALYDFNILPVPYLQMELCQRSLIELPKPLDIERAAGMMFHIAEGVKYAHSRNTIHRDLKPHNILLQGEIPKIVDWGLSRVLAESMASSHTQGQTFSLYWAAPEQLSPQELGKPDHRTDIYQLGIVFYELATGELPFKGESFVEIMGQIVAGQPALPSSLNAAAIMVESIILKCMQREMNDRYQTIGDMQKDLADYLKIEYKDSLAKSQGNMRRSGYYCAELCLVHLARGDIAEALIYAMDLNHYAGEATKADLTSLVKELEYRSREGIEIEGQLVDRAAIILHQARVGR